MKPVIVGRIALNELKDAADFYEEQAAEVDQAFRLQITEALTRIGADPELYPAYLRSEYQRCLVNRFPFGIIYLDFPDHVWIAAIAHHSRRPGYWMGRGPDDDLAF